MENEIFISGYCRTLDESRMVIAVTEDRKLLEVDCSYETCPHTASCTVARKISEMLGE